MRVTETTTTGDFDGFTFYLGASRSNWLQEVIFPLFISYLRIGHKKRLKPSRCSFALDSGGFTILNKYGEYPISPREYATGVKRISEYCGHLDWAAVQDWMCEPFVLKKTGKSIDEHQLLTIKSYLDLREIEPSINWVPVLQGYKATDYWRHIDMYEDFGIDLTKFSTVGIGSICRRQGTLEAETIIRTVASSGIRLHGFGLKTQGLRRVAKYLVSADSMAWSFKARKEKLLREDCAVDGMHKNCANCLLYAKQWRQELIYKLHEHNEKEILQEMRHRAA
jgi:hypothetical protein